MNRRSQESPVPRGEQPPPKLKANIAFKLIGRNSMKLETTTLKQKVTISASPQEVYEAFVDPKKHSAFTGSKATGKAKPGGKFTAWDGYSFGKYIEFESGKCLVQEWQTTDWPEGYPPSRFELTFREVPEGTEISMVHSNIPAAQKEELAEGWEEFYWQPLKKYFTKT